MVYHFSEVTLPCTRIVQDHIVANAEPMKIFTPGILRALESSEKCGEWSIVNWEQGCGNRQRLFLQAPLCSFYGIRNRTCWRLGRFVVDDSLKSGNFVSASISARMDFSERHCTVRPS